MTVFTVRRLLFGKGRKSTERAKGADVRSRCDGTILSTGVPTNRSRSPPPGLACAALYNRFSEAFLSRTREPCARSSVCVPAVGVGRSLGHPARLCPEVSGRSLRDRGFPLFPRACRGPPSDIPTDGRNGASRAQERFCSAHGSKAWGSAESRESGPRFPARQRALRQRACLSPSFLMRAARVVGLMPSSSAAPPGP